MTFKSFGSPEWWLGATVLIPFVVMALILVVGRRLGRHSAWLFIAAAAGALALVLALFGASPREAPLALVVPWIPSLNISLAFRADWFGLFFAMLISGIGLLVGLYALTYIDPGQAANRTGRFYAALSAFMGAMLGVALADDLLLLFVFWEITSITSFLLIGYFYEEEHARRGAMTALLVTSLGGLAMMAGFVMVGVITDTYRISELMGNAALKAQLSTSPLFLAAFVLILIGAFTKSAQVPFHFWLPGAMVAPTPVSTYLHAATMVKAGIFLTGRLLPIFGDNAWWSPILVGAGLCTFVLGAYQAMHEYDLKAILARTTLSTLGLVMMIYGLKGAEEDALQLFSHATYKGALFLVAGIVEHAVHTRDLRELGGLRHKMPITFIICVLAACSMAGLPPFFGFLAKEVLYDALLHNQVLIGWSVLRWPVILLTVFANAMLFAVALRLVIGIFLGPKSHAAEHAHEPSPMLWLPPAILAGAALALGVLGATHTTESLVNKLSSQKDAHMHVSLTPIHFAPLGLTIVTIGLGILLYRRRERFAALQVRMARTIPSMQSIWDEIIHSITWTAETFSSRWQNGSLRWYFIVILSFTVGLGSYGLSRGNLSLKSVTLSIEQMPWYGGVLAVLLCATTILVVRSATRLGAAIALTATGFLVSLIFVVYRSPDILLTQILIETVATILVLLVIYFMPPFKKDLTSPARKFVDLAVAVAVGAVMFVFLLLSTSAELRETDNLAGEYLSRAMPQAGGRNAVNVIIVDFRAIDTTGEVCVLVVVGLLVFGLLRARRKLA